MKQIIPTYEEALEIRKEYEDQYGPIRQIYRIQEGGIIREVGQEEYCRHMNITPEMLIRQYITFDNEQVYETWKTTRKILSDEANQGTDRTKTTRDME